MHKWQKEVNIKIVFNFKTENPFVFSVRFVAYFVEYNLYKSVFINKSECNWTIYLSIIELFQIIITNLFTGDVKCL